MWWKFTLLCWMHSTSQIFLQLKAFLRAQKLSISFILPQVSRKHTVMSNKLCYKLSCLTSTQGDSVMFGGSHFNYFNWKNCEGMKINGIRGNCFGHSHQHISSNEDLQIKMLQRPSTSCHIERCCFKMLWKHLTLNVLHLNHQEKNRLQHCLTKSIDCTSVYGNNLQILD